MDVQITDIRINYSSDVSNVGTIIYDQNLRNNGENQANPHWKKDLTTFFILLFTYYIDYCRILLF